MKLHLPIILIFAGVCAAFGQTPAASPIPVSTPTAEADDQPIKVNTFLVNIPIIASDRDGRNIANLTKDNFTITQDGEKQPIEFFANSEAPINVTIMIDTSGSTKPIINEIKNAAINFIKALRPEDRAMVVTFDGQYKFLCELTADHKELNKAVNSAQMIQLKDFSMYDAIYDVIKNKFAAIQGRKAIVLLTDGGEYGNRVTEKQIVSTLVEADTVVYPILFNSDLGYFSKSFLSQKMILGNGQEITRGQFAIMMRAKRTQFMESLGTITGGRLYESESKDFKKTFQSIADELKKQYLVGFYPQNLEDGKMHQVAVEVNPKDIIIRTKRRIELKPAN